MFLGRRSYFGVSPIADRAERDRAVSWSQFVGQVGSEVKVYSCC
jgi:hypothetical protein